MVFCGKPSKGCSHCRARRIKCDQLDPACSQCLRAGKDCPGYRDQLSLLFRDESEKVVKKAQLPKQTSEQRKRPRVQTKTPSVTSSEPEDLNNKSELISGWLQTPDAQSGSTTQYSSQHSQDPAQDEGCRFFFTHYVTAITKGLVIDLPSSPLWPLLYINKSYFNAVSSVGFAGLSNVTKDPKHMVIARKKYAESLRDITHALKDTSKSDLNATFISVMLLAAYEVVNGAGPSRNNAWGIHLDGGAAILRMIGATRNGALPKTRMQIQFVFSVYIKCLSKRESSPSNMEEWAERCRQSMSPNDAHAATLSSITHRLVNIQAEVKKQNPLYDPPSVFQAILALDAELEAWNNQLPETWRFTTESVPADSEFIYGGKVVYKGQMHVYHDLWTSRVYNNYRWTRLLINELLIVHLSELEMYTNEVASQKLRSLEIVNQLAEELCTSVSAQFDRYTLQQACNKQIPPMSGCFLLLFPLAVAGSGIGVSEELHLWTIQMLEVFGNQMGISQALEMIPIMKAQRRRWIDGYAESGYQIFSDGGWFNNI